MSARRFSTPARSSRSPRPPTISATTAWAIPDHVINLETLQTPYPYTKDGQRRWEPFTDWPDPWVMIGALALVTTRLRFVTTVYMPAMRDPYSAAKAIGTAAYLADGRLELGIGVGWCEEEFT